MRNVYALFLFFGFIVNSFGTVPSQVEFVAVLSDIERQGGTSGILMMSLTPDFEFRVRVTPQSEIRDENDFPLDLGQLRVGMKLKIEGIFTNEGILASEIDVTQNQHEFEVKGEIEAIDPSGNSITVAGLLIPVSALAKIKTEEGILLHLDQLEVGQFVNVEGSMIDGVFTAFEVKVNTFGEGRSRLSFNGKVSSIEDSEILVFIEGVSDVLVRLHPETVIRGKLATGLKVRVFGTIGMDLAIDATEIEEQRLIQLVPDEIGMHFQQIRRVDIVLGQTVESDTEIGLFSIDPGIAHPTVSSVIVPAGKLTATFDIESGSIEGRTMIEAELPSSLGGETALVEIEVETDNSGDDQSDDSSDDSGDDSGNSDDQLLEIKFSPDKLRGVSGETMVQLVLNQPAPSSQHVPLVLAEGLPGEVTFPSSVTFTMGSQFVDIPITVGDLSGNVKIRAILPASLGGDTASLQIEAEADEEEEWEVEWMPDDVEAGFNETRTVQLVLDRPAPFDLAAALSLNKGENGLVQFPSEVTFAAGNSQVSVQITTMNVEGEVEILAALPFSVGGKTDKLKVEVSQ